ncbi:2-dehydropantoate 2-reductase [Tumebacillus sp. DT12]|uniref:2-dehydropantoate 2-reductase n=1 Tax=Tumebacillus lacus TaxID=2995335 RepID=A0ABT3XA21_9BACL|nr:2-dehydropantoate 2-reductase [Tumebacillus lacus]MCX7571594.1 2-dehydropantoate 2-reductase [Tumebacillus lacus]
MNRRIAIIGAGAIGRMLAWTLRQGGQEAVLICRRTEQAAALKKQGLLFYETDGTEHRVEVEAVTWDTSDRLPAVDGAILTVKSYDTSAAGELLRVRLPDVPVLSMQNGLGNGERLVELVPPEQIALGLTTHGATADGETSVYYKGRGRTVIGDFLAATTESGAKWWAELFTGCGHPVTVADDIRTEVWRKAMVNIGINPMTALHGLKNGELPLRTDLLAVSRSLVEEAERVAAAAGVALHDSFARVLDVCRTTAGNRSSMLQDLERGRKTEIDAMCGEIVRLGKEHGVPTPCNERVYQQVLQAERDGKPGDK